MIKIKIYSPDIHSAARLAGSMNLHITQWDWVGEHIDHPQMTWAYCEPLFEEIERLERKLSTMHALHDSGHHWWMEKSDQVRDWMIYYAENINSRALSELNEILGGVDNGNA